MSASPRVIAPRPAHAAAMAHAPTAATTWNIEAPTGPRPIGIGLVVGLMSFATYLAVGLYLDGLHVHTAESLWVVEKAWIGRFGPDPKLAAIGLTHPSLPFLTSLVSCLVVPIRAAPRIASAALGAGLLTLVALALRRESGGRTTPLVIATTIALGLNPLVLFDAVSGNSQMVFLFAFAFFVMAIQRLEDQGTIDILNLLFGGLWLGAAFFANYEALPLFAMVLPGMLWSWWRMPPGEPQDRRRAAIVVLAMPVVYAGCVWLFLNWLIMHDALYFLTSVYSIRHVVEQETFNDPLLATLKDHPVESLEYVLRGIAILAPAYLAVPLLVRGVTRWLVLAPLVLIAGELVLSYTRMDVDKFAVFSVMAAVTLVGRNAPRWVRPWMRPAFLSLACVSNLAPYASLDTLTHRADELRDHVARLRSGEPSTRWAEEEKVGARVGELVRTQNARILMDDSSGFAVVVFSGAPSGFYTPAHKDFLRFVEHPAGNVDYLLVPSPERSGGADALLKIAPQLFYTGAPDLSLTEDFGSWRLFRVRGSAG